MKTLLLFAICHLPFAIQSSAALAIYNGTGRATFYGNGQTIKSTAKSVLVVDTDSHDAWEITATVFVGLPQKIYYVRHLQNFRIGTADAGGSTYTYLATASDDGLNLESVFLKGKNATLSVALGRYDFIPRTLAGPSRAITGGLFGEIDQTFALDIKNSQRSNAANFTILDVVTAAELNFERLGYTNSALQ